MVTYPIKNNEAQELPRVVYTADKRVEVKPKDVVKYTVYDKTYYGLVVAVVGSYVTMIRILTNPKFCQNHSLHLNSSFFDDELDHHANVFNTMITINQSQVENVCGTVTDLVYYEIVSGVVKFMLGNFHLDDDGNYILDDVYVKNPFPALMFGMGTMADMRAINKEKYEKEEKKKEENKVMPPEEKKEKYTKQIPSTPAAKKLKPAVEKISATNLNPNILDKMGYIYTKSTTDRIDEIFNFFSEYLINNKLPVDLVYNWRFNKKVPLRKRMKETLWYITKQEMAFFINCTSDDAVGYVSKKTGSAASSMSTYDYVKKIHCIFNGNRSNPRRLITIDKDVFAKKYNELGCDSMTISDAVIAMINTDEFANEKIKSMYKRIHQYRLNGSCDIPKSADKANSNRWKSVNTDDRILYYADNPFIKLLGGDIESRIIDIYDQNKDNLIMIMDGTMTIATDVKTKFAFYYTLFSSNSKLSLYRFLEFNCNQDIVEWLNSNSCSSIYNGAKNIPSHITSKMLGFKLMAHYVSVTEDELESLREAKGNVTLLSKRLYKLIRVSKPNKLYTSYMDGPSKYIMKYISEITGIALPTLIHAASLVDDFGRGNHKGKYKFV